MFHIYKNRYGVNKKKVVFLLTGWQGTQAQHWLFAKLIEKTGYYCITYTYDKEILDPNPKVTVENVSHVVVDLLEEISRLNKQNIHDITIIGTSMGNIPAVITANKSADVDKLILNMCGNDMAQIIWSWDHVIKGFKSEMLRNGVTLEKLSQEWKSINPKNNLANLKNKKILLLLSKKDTIIPFQQADELRKSLIKINASTIVKTSNHFGHFLYGVINLLRMPLYLSDL